MPLEPSGLNDARARFACAREDLAQAEALRFRADPAAVPEDLAGRVKVLEVTLETLLRRLFGMPAVSEIGFLGLATDAMESEIIRLEAGFLARAGGEQ
jgi:hypothetical protein